LDWFWELFSAYRPFGGQHDHKVAMPKEFEFVKGLVGTWEGTSKGMDGKEEKVSVIYELTSGGTAVVEKLMPGTPHEMVSVYHKDGNSIAMTHYCALGNAPQMALKKLGDKTIEFEMTKPIGISSPKEDHMHSVKLTKGDNTLTQEWTSIEKGQKSKTPTVFTFAKK
jgi:hypothetical protein